MKFILTVLVTSFAVIIGAYLMPGVSIDGFLTAILVALVLGLLNALLKPILIIITLPVTLMTLGLFLLVINAFIIQLADLVVKGFEINSFWTALLFSLILSVITWLLNLPVRKNQEYR